MAQELIFYKTPDGEQRIEVVYGDYVEQITYLLFLKLAEEMRELGFENPIPAEYQWSELRSKTGDPLELQYRHTLENLGKEPGLVGIIYRKAQNKISNPSDLQRGPIDGGPKHRSFTVAVVVLETSPRPTLG